MTMTKQKLSEILNSLGIPVGEGEHFLDKNGEYPKIAYWGYILEDEMASGDDYEELMTYQVSFASRKPWDPKILQLKRILNDMHLHPTIYQEYVKRDGMPGHFHNYFSLQVFERVTDEE